MPQFISTQQSLNIEFKDRFAEMEAMRNNLAEQVNKFRKDQPTMSESQIKAEEARLTELNKQFESKAAPLQKE
jgi:outer membrane protein